MTEALPLTAHPFVRGMAANHIDRLSRVTRYITVPARRRIFDEGGTADRCWLIVAGQVALLVVAVPAVPVDAWRDNHATHTGV